MDRVRQSGRTRRIVCMGCWTHTKRGSLGAALTEYSVLLLLVTSSAVLLLTNFFTVTATSIEETASQLERNGTAQAEVVYVQESPQSRASKGGDDTVRAERPSPYFPPETSAPAPSDSILPVGGGTSSTGRDPDASGPPPLPVCAVADPTCTNAPGEAVAKVPEE